MLFTFKDFLVNYFCNILELFIKLTYPIQELVKNSFSCPN